MTDELLRAQVRACRRCGLREGCHGPVYGTEGRPLFLIGEAPGAHEDATGQPFVGASGKFLMGLLAEVGLGRDDFFVTNAVKCRPPANRTPRRAEVATCAPWLTAQLELYQPWVVLTLGAVPLGLFLSGVKVTDTMGRLVTATLGGWSGLVMPLVHPAYAMRFRGASEGPLVEMRRALAAVAERVNHEKHG